MCRTCATNRTYSAACSGVIFSKFSICGHFAPSWYNLSIFLFACLYGLLFGLCGRVGFSGPSTLGFRVQYFPCHIRDGFGTGVAPKEHCRTRPVKPFAPTARQRINFATFPERAFSANRCKYLYWHKLNTFSNCSTVVTRSRHSNQPTINVPSGFHPIRGFPYRIIIPDFSTHPRAANNSFVIFIL